MNIREKLCLQWNDFKENVASSFRDLRAGQEFTDVTLACADGKQIEAHKVVLAASCPLFMEILKGTKHPHPLIYMRGSRSDDLLAILDFLYFGEAEVFQENLESFLGLAQELRLNGLVGAENLGKLRDPPSEASEAGKILENIPPVKKEKAEKTEKPSGHESQTPTNRDKETASNVVSNDSAKVDLHELDLQIRSMMTTTKIRSSDGKRFLASCNVCGKESEARNMPGHIESNHITGVSYTCNICGRFCKSRDTLRKHKNIH